LGHRSMQSISVQGGGEEGCFGLNNDFLIKE
jgi:hypothetical protein